MFFQNDSEKNNCIPVGLFGGTFNPFHKGHIELALHAYNELSLSKVIVMPTGNPPHKKEQRILDARYRCDMVRLAIESYPMLEFSDYEVRREGYSYSSETLAQFVKMYPNIFFIIGADSLFKIETWHCPQDIMKLATIVAANRNGHTQAELAAQAEHLRNRYNARIIFLDMPDVPVSSSDIRYRVSAGKAVTGMVEPAVEKYIYENGLYRSE